MSLKANFNLNKVLVYLPDVLYFGSLYILGFAFSWIVRVKHEEIVSFVNSLSTNELEMIIALLGAGTTIIAATVGVLVAFNQIRKQFEHKVIHAAWEDFQGKLFEFSSSLTEYGSKISWLTYFLENQDNPLVNGGNIRQYRTDKWNEINDSQHRLISSLVRLLQSFETHEIIFIPLRKMKRSFNEECEEIGSQKYMNFMEAIFPEYYGEPREKTLDEMQEIINSHWRKTMDITSYLDDFRMELQNETLGKILNKRLEKRVPTESCMILTKEGFIPFHPKGS